MKEDTKVSPWRRHFDGWQAGLLVVVIAGGAILVSVPRAVQALEFPIVIHGAQAVHQAFERDRLLARGVRKKPLDVDVRHLGREIRAYNRAAAEADLDALATARTRVARAAVKAYGAAGADALRRLRAFQTMRFIDSLRRWEQGGVVSDELLALGGDVVTMLQRNRWCRGDRKLLLDNATLRVMYQQRWNQLVAVRAPMLAPSLPEQRHRFLFLLRHPFSSDASNLSSQAKQARAERMAVKPRLATIRRLKQLLPSYPAMLAQGVTYYRAGMWAGAVAAFDQHLAEHADGPYRLRAQNYLKAALDRVNGAQR